MDLCIDARMLSCGGIGTFLKNLIPHFSPKGTLLIVRPDDLAAHPWLNSYPLKLSQAPIYSLQEQIELPRLVPSCALFWSPHYNIPLLPLRAKKRMVTIHDTAHLHFKKTLNWKERLYASIVFRQATLRSDLITTVSSFSKREIVKHLLISPDQIQVIPNGVDLNRFSCMPSAKKLEELRKTYSLPERFFLFIGNLKPHKNLKLILDVYTQFSLPIPTVVIGKRTALLHPDPLIDSIQASPLLKKKIHLTGEVADEDVPYFYYMALALLFPSLYEGFGLPPLEAMASGCPVIASSAAGIPEVCGEGAHFIDPHDPQALFQAINDIVYNTDLRALLKKKGKARAALFSWNSAAEQYLNLMMRMEH